MWFKKPVLTGGECSAATAEVSGPIAGKSRDFFETGRPGSSLALVPRLDIRREMVRTEHGANQRLASAGLSYSTQQIGQ